MIKVGCTVLRPPLRCVKRRIAEKLFYPSSMSVDPFSIHADQAQGSGNWGVALNFKAMNGAGNIVAQVGHCILTPEGQIESDVLPR